MANRERSWVGSTFSSGRYELLARLGGGAMGTVYRAIDHNIDAEVVVKIPLDTMLADPDFAPRFDREIRALVKLSHPHIVKVSDVGNHEGTPFAIMQYLRGGDMDNRRPKRPDGSPAPMPPESLVSWLEDIANALDFMHAKGYIHRDIKPTNILFDDNDEAYLADFGVVGALANTPAASTRALTAQGLVIGTPEYMAPEIIRGKPFDGRADQYSLAIVVYELLAGRRPFEGNSATDLIVLQSTEPPPPLRELAPHVSESLARVVHRGLEKQPASRFANCAAFAREVLNSPKEPDARVTITAVTPESRSVTCLNCGTPFKLISKYVSKRIECPGCHLYFRVLHDLSLEPLEKTGRQGTIKLDLGSGTIPMPPESPSEGASPPKTAKTKKISAADLKEKEPQGTIKLDLGGENIGSTAKTKKRPTADSKGSDENHRKRLMIAGALGIGIVCVFLTYITYSGATKPPEVNVDAPSAKSKGVMVASPKPPPVVEKRPRRRVLPKGFLVVESFDTDDIDEGKLPEGWDGNLIVVQNQASKAMELSLAKDEELGSAALSFPDGEKIQGDFECLVKFQLPAAGGAGLDGKAESSHLTFSLTNSPLSDHDLFLEIGSTKDFGTLKVFQRPSEAADTTYQEVDLSPERPSEFVFKRKSGQYDVSINGKRVEKLRFPKYDGSFERANLALKRSSTEIRPFIVSVRLRADGEPPRQELARATPPPVAENSEPPPPPAPAAAASPPPKRLANGLKVDFSTTMLAGWKSAYPVDLKRYYIRPEDKALALVQPGLSFSYPFIEHRLEQPIDGDFVLTFELKIPNENSEVAIRRHPSDGEPILIIIHGDSTYTLNNGIQSMKKKPLQVVKSKDKNRFELRSVGGRLELKAGGTSVAKLPNRLGAKPFDQLGIQMTTDREARLSPLLYSLDLQPLNP